MSLRWKFALIAGGLAATAALAASAVGYFAVRDQLVSQVDESLLARADRLAGVIGGRRGPAAEHGPGPMRGIERGRIPPPGPEGGPEGGPDDGDTGDRLFLVQVIGSKGAINAVSGVRLPVDRTDRELAAAGEPRPPRIREVGLQGESGEARLVTVAIPGGGAAQVARSVEEMNETLSNLRTRMLLITVAVIALAALVGLLLSGRATASLARLTRTAEEVAVTGQPDAEITVGGRDEIGRLGRSFSQMLASLARSREQQQRLIQDAGHELRTPLTSLRTNISVLERFSELPEDDRRRLLADLSSETGEMSLIVDELVELTVGGDDEPTRSVELERLARRTAARAERRSGREVVVRAEPVTVEGRPRSLERAIGNLIDNAAKFDGSGAPIELTVTGDRIEVADRGPGIPPDQRELVFERFHRTIEARSVPGSGLGLAIVRQVAAMHGGDAYALEREGGGAIVGFTFGAKSAG